MTGVDVALQTPAANDATAIVAAMPKAELHVHLDGCLRLSTIVDLAAAQNVVLPAGADRLREACVVPEDCPSLAAYLDRFVIPISVMQTADALERTVYELCEDARSENVRYIEPRFAPALHTSSGLSLNEVIAAACRGWKAAARDFEVFGGLVLCAMRSMPPNTNIEVAQAGEPFLGEGVVGFDIAGDEAPFPVLEHRAAFEAARAAGYGLTAHAGEGDGAQSVRDAVEVIGVSRVGHGTRSHEDPTLLRVLRDRRICLDMCPYSNLQTKSVAAMTEHPIRSYFDYGIPVTVSTDSRTCSDTTVSREMRLIHDALDFSVAELWQTTQTALEVGFASTADRASIAAAYRREMATLLPQT